MSWPKFWNQKSWQAYALMPLSKLVCWEASRRYKHFKLTPSPPSNTDEIKPHRTLVVVVGNLVVGGTGKTPYILWLSQQLKKHNLKFGIISRGYGAKSKLWPKLVTDYSIASEIGDEPFMLYQQIGCPVAVSPVRTDALALLNRKYDLDVVISDDGLQHFALQRDIEVVMIDAQRQFGNGFCMPSGPLREALSRLADVDFSVWNGLDEKDDIPQLETAQKSPARLQLQPVSFCSLNQPDRSLSIEEFVAKYGRRTVSAIAGIGNPQRFFQTLMSLGLKVDGHAFSDHHQFHSIDLEKFPKPLIMTEKDAVKCGRFSQKGWWYLKIAPESDSAIMNAILNKL